MKEGKWKRVPIHRDLIPTLSDVMKVQAIGSDKIFLVRGKSPYPDWLKNPWNKAVKAIGLDPFLGSMTFATLGRRTRCVPAWIRRSEKGSWDIGTASKNMNERYGRISDADLVPGCGWSDIRSWRDRNSGRHPIKEKSDSRATIPLSEILGTNWEQSATTLIMLTTLSG